VQNIRLLIADEIQQVGGEVGPTYEIVSAASHVPVTCPLLLHAQMSV